MTVNFIDIVEALIDVFVPGRFEAKWGARGSRRRVRRVRRFGPEFRVDYY